MDDFTPEQIEKARRTLAEEYVKTAFPGMALHALRHGYRPPPTLWEEIRSTVKHALDGPPDFSCDWWDRVTHVLRAKFKIERRDEA